MIVFVGDLFIGTKRVSISKELLKKIDIPGNAIVFNLESVVLKKKLNNQRKDKSSILFTDYEMFKAFLNLFNYAELYFNIGNNHLHDFGDLGIEKTIENLKELNVNFFGTNGKFKDNSSLGFNYKEKKIRLLALSTAKKEVMSVTDTSESYYVEDIGNVTQERILELKEYSDVVFALPHWGKEYVPFPTLENVNYAKEWNSWGIDAIIGTHPHIIQGSLDDVTFFSLGNFYFSNFRLKNKVWHFWKRRNRRSLVVALDLSGSSIKSEIIGVEYNKQEIFISSKAKAFYSFVNSQLRENVNDEKRYFGFYEKEYYKFLKSIYGPLNRRFKYAQRLSILIFEKLFRIV